MRLIKAFQNYMAGATVEAHAQAEYKAAQLEIAQSNETIKRAAYIRFMAQARINAIDQWLDATVFASQESNNQQTNTVQGAASHDDR